MKFKVLYFIVYAIKNNLKIDLICKELFDEGESTTSYFVIFVIIFFFSSTKTSFSFIQ